MFPSKKFTYNIKKGYLLRIRLRSETTANRFYFFILFLQLWFYQGQIQSTG